MILEAIFNGQIYPAETVVPKCKKFRDAGEAVANIMVYFEQKLSNLFEDFRYFYEHSALGYSNFWNDFVHIVCDYALSFQSECEEID